MGIETHHLIRHSLDEKAARLAHGSASVRLAFGEALAAFTQRSLHHELGFSNIAGYVIQRCDLSPRFAADSTALARRLERTPLLRQHLIAGELGWSRAELLSKLVEASSEAGEPPVHSELEWLANSKGKTCLVLRDELATLKANTAVDPSEPHRTLTFTLPERSVWLFQAAELICRRMDGECTREQFFEALLAEATTMLQREAPDAAETERQQRLDEWRAQLAEWREAAEQRCEAQRPDLPAAKHSSTVASIPRNELATWSTQRLDAHVVALARQITRHDIELGELAWALHRHEVWLQLGFSSEAHYARERLGLSMSSLKQKRLLARRLAHRPEVREAVLRGLIGHRAALLITRVCNEVNTQRWIERARQRTVKHLTEEVGFVERVLTRRPNHAALPPSPATMRASLAVEGYITSGRRWLAPDRRPTKAEATVQRYEEEHISGAQNQGPGPLGMRRGHVRLKLRISEGTLSLFREVERGFRKLSGRGSLLDHLVRHFLDVWCPTLVSNRAYEHVYMRDRYRCSNPVCTRHDITPHHLVYRSRGGGDEDENLASLCVWCHLEGVHGGRIVARRVDGEVHWRIGRVNVTLVQGRTRLNPSEALPQAA